MLLNFPTFFIIKMYHTIVQECKNEIYRSNDLIYLLNNKN